MQHEAGVIDLALARDVAAVREAFAAFRDAAATAQMRRLELGRALAHIRPRWPERGPAAKGWGDFLATEGIDQDVALVAMKYAEAVDGQFPANSRETLPTLADVGLRAPREPQPIPPPAAELGAPPAEPDTSDEQQPPSGSSEVEVDRDTWCTPKWITEALGPVDLDPCANARSHVQARVTFCLDRGEDGLVQAPGVGALWRVFLNPPYSDVRPWIDAYKHTRFVFLLKLDPSTKWFAELYAHTARILIPRGTRVQFEPPPGVPPEKAHANPFPHALFFARADDVPAALLEQCFDWTLNHDHDRN